MKIYGIATKQAVISYDCDTHEFREEVKDMREEYDLTGHCDENGHHLMSSSALTIEKARKKMMSNLRYNIKWYQRRLAPYIGKTLTDGEKDFLQKLYGNELDLEMKMLEELESKFDKNGKVKVA